MGRWRTKQIAWAGVANCRGHDGNLPAPVHSQGGNKSYELMWEEIAQRFYPEGSTIRLMVGNRLD